MGIIANMVILLSMSIGVVPLTTPRLSTDEIIKTINEMNTTWVAGRNFDNVDQYKNMVGAIRKHNHNLPVYDDLKTIQFPENFDSRLNWPMCESLNEIRNQGLCGSCWAISVTAAATDRYCIHSDGLANFHFSTLDVISCFNPGVYGCNGGEPAFVWEKWIERGIVSGGNSEDEGGCRPYILGDVSCKETCNKDYPLTYEADKKFGRSAYRLINEEHMKQDIYLNGPIVANFVVYEDFYSYKSGVYQHETGDELSGHAVKILGWGVEDSVPYWLCANSWGTRWGDSKGFFKILRGSNECGIEELVYSGLPKYDNASIHA